MAAERRLLLPAAMLLLPDVLAFSPSSDTMIVTAQAWCANSVRLRIRPAAPSPATRAAAADLAMRLKVLGLSELPGALVTDHCVVGRETVLSSTSPSFTDGSLGVEWRPSDSTLAFSRADQPLFSATPSFAPSRVNGSYLSASLTTRPADPSERIFGLGQGNWTGEGGCPSGEQRVVPIIRNGQSVNLQQRKFHVSIPFAYSSRGYGLLFHMGGYGSVTVGQQGGTAWTADAALEIDLWVSVSPAASSAPASPGIWPGAAGAPAGIIGSAPPPSPHASVYRQYADATGHTPAPRPNALLFWQSRNRYVSSAVALSVAQRYSALQLPVGVLVIDYKNQKTDGDFAPDVDCYPSVAALASGVQALLNASTVFSFWPEVKTGAQAHRVLDAAGCLINSALGGRVVDATAPRCRRLIWDTMVGPRYFEQGVDAFWLDETDGEGTGGGGDGDHGYDTALGPAAAFSNLWVNQWLRLFSEPVRAAGVSPLVLTRGVWAGGARYGAVLWSSDIWSSFEQLRSQVVQGVHASLSGIPWWTTDVGGYGCGIAPPLHSPLMRELIVRWFQFGLFSPIFRTHGCRSREGAPTDPPTPGCVPAQPSCGPNEAWSYGPNTLATLSRYIRFRASHLQPYLAELALNISRDGGPSMRPLWWDFGDDPLAISAELDDQYLLGPSLLVAPVVTQGATSRSVYFPAGATWRNVFDPTETVRGGVRRAVPAPLTAIPAYWRE